MITPSVVLPLLLLVATTTAAQTPAGPPATDAGSTLTARPDSGPTNTAPTDSAPQAPGQPAPVGTGQGMVASVNGEPITSADILYHAGAAGGSLDKQRLHKVRRQLAEQILLASEAERLGVKLSDAYVDDYWERYRGAKPDYAALGSASGTTEERQRELARRSVLADQYVYHRVGIWNEFGQQIKPDPLLAHLVEVTPKEIRDLFREEHDAFDLPASVTYRFYPCRDQAQAQGVAEALRAGLVPTDVRPGQETAPLPVVPDVFSFSPELVAFLQHAEPGTVSQPFQADMGWVVFSLQERAAGRPAQFSEVQEELRRRMRISRLEVARHRILADLQAKAVYLPRDLFKLETEPAKLSGQAAASSITRP